jgi:hypothetical protein
MSPNKERWMNGIGSGDEVALRMRGRVAMAEVPHLSIDQMKQVAGLGGYLEPWPGLP